MNRKKIFSVVIAGAGPAGLLLGRDLARSGISVSIYEKSKRSASAHNWSDAIEIQALKAAGFDIPATRNGSFSGKLVKKNPSAAGLFEKHVVNPLQIWAPDMSCRTAADVEFRYILTDRVVLNSMLRKQAQDAGVKIIYEYMATGLLGATGGGLEKIKIDGVRFRHLRTGRIIDIAADITVDATGYNSVLRTGLSAGGAMEKKYGRDDLAIAYRTVRKLDRKKLRPGGIPDHYRYGAYKGYFWTHLHDDETIDVGGGVKDEPGRKNPKGIVDAIIAEYPEITSRELRGGGGSVLVGQSPYSLSASGFLAVGDAAGQTIPTTGCGVGAGITGAILAAETIIEAARQGNTGIGMLWNYNSTWFAGSGRGANIAALGALKDVLQNLSHDEIAFLIRQDILSGEMLTPSINGIFYVPDFKTMLKTLVGGLSRPALLMKLNKATTLGKKVFHHYSNYPQTWNPAEFARWMKTAERYFRSAKN